MGQEFADLMQKLADEAQGREMEIARLTAKVEKYRANLRTRDEFIGAKGLWDEFVASLPR